MPFARETISSLALTIPVGPHRASWQEPLHDQRLISNVDIDINNVRNDGQAVKSINDNYFDKVEEEEEFMVHSLLWKIAHRLENYLIQLVKQILHYPWYHPYAIQQLFYERHIEIKYVIDEYTRAALVHVGRDKSYRHQEMSSQRDEESYFSLPDETNDEGEVRIKGSNQDLRYNGLYNTVRVVSFPPEVLHSSNSVNKTSTSEEQLSNQYYTQKKSNQSKIITIHKVNQGELVCQPSSITQALIALEEYRETKQANNELYSASRQRGQRAHSKGVSTSGSYTLRGVAYALNWIYRKFADELEEEEEELQEYSENLPSFTQGNGKASNKLNDKHFFQNSHYKYRNDVLHESNSTRSAFRDDSSHTMKRKLKMLHTKAKRAITFLQNAHEELGPFLYNDKKEMSSTVGMSNNDMNAYTRRDSMSTSPLLFSSSSPEAPSKENKRKIQSSASSRFSPSSSSSLFSLLLNGIKSSFIPSSLLSSSPPPRERIFVSAWSILPSWVLQWIGQRVLATEYKLTEETFTTLHTLSSYSSSSSSSSLSKEEYSEQEHVPMSLHESPRFTGENDAVESRNSKSEDVHDILHPSLSHDVHDNMAKHEEKEEEELLSLASVSAESQTGTPSQSALKVYHTKVWFHFTAYLSASRAFCLAVEAVPHSYKSSSLLSPRHEEPVEETRISNDKWEEPSHNGKAIQHTSSVHKNTHTKKRPHSSTEPHAMGNEQGVNIYVSQKVYFDRLWFKLFVIALSLYYTQSFLIKSNLVHFTLAGVCGLLVLAILATVYVIRKVKQMTVGQASMVLILAMGGVTAFTEGVLVIVRHYAESIKENLAGEWAVYLLLVVLIIATFSSIAARLLFPPSSLEITSKICVALITYGLWVITFMRRREATLLTLLLLLVIRYFIIRRWWKRSALCVEPYIDTTYASTINSLQRANEENSRATPEKEVCLTTHTPITKSTNTNTTSTFARLSDKLAKPSRFLPQEQQKQNVQKVEPEAKEHEAYKYQCMSRNKSKSRSCERDGPVDDLPPEAKQAQKFVTPLAEEGLRYTGIRGQVSSHMQHETNQIQPNKPLSHAEKMRCYCEEGAEFTRKALDELAQRLRQSPACYVEKVRDPNRIAQWAGSQYESSHSDYTSSDDKDDVSPNN